MLKPLSFRPWTTTARQLSTTSRSTILRGASSSSSSSLLLRAFTIPSFASYSTDSPSEPTPDPWKEWIRPNRRAQARQELYGDRWPETQTGRERGNELKIQGQREKTRDILRAQLGDKYDAVVEETIKEAYERYKSKEWREHIERHKREIIEKDARRRKEGVLDIEVLETEFRG